MNLDSKDKAILRVLVKDGRASLREVAARVSLTTPTVSARLARMQKAGIIKGFAPILDPAMKSGIRSFIRLKVPTKDIESAARVLARLPEVDGVFLTVGGGNLLLKLSTTNLEEVATFARRRLGGKGWEVQSTEVVERAVKDVTSTVLPEAVFVALKCDYCGQEVKAERPYNIKVGLTRHYFCCRTCRKSFLAEHRSEIQAGRRRLNNSGLRL